jgi:diaminopimelate epimerase
MQALGNDFVVFVDVIPSTEQIRLLADRHYGIGADQVLCLFPDKGPPSLTFFNADGSTAEMCGNGLRCAGLLLQRLTTQSAHTIRTTTRTHVVEVLEAQTVRVNMGTIALLPPVAPDLLFAEASVQGLQPLVQHYGLVDVGNPHVVFFLHTSDVLATASRFGPVVETMTLFPRRINVGFAYADAHARTITLAVWERGVGLTKACGSGAIAAAALGYHLYAIAGPIRVLQEGGAMTVDKENAEYIQTGPAHFVFEGDLLLR